MHYKSPQKGSTSLHWAAYNGRLDLIFLLLARGAKVEAVTKVRSLLFMTCGAVSVLYFDPYTHSPQCKAVIVELRSHAGLS